MFWIKFVEEIKTHLIFSNFFFRVSRRLRDIVEKYCTAGQATDGHIIRRIRMACWVNKALNSHSEYVIFIAFPVQESYAIAPHR